MFSQQLEQEHGEDLVPSLKPGRCCDRSVEKPGGNVQCQSPSTDSRVPQAELRRHLRGSDGSEVVAVVKEHFALLQKVVAHAVPRVHSFQPVAEAAEIVADGDEHVEDAPVSGIVTVVVLVALDLHRGKTRGQ